MALLQILIVMLILVVGLIYLLSSHIRKVPPIRLMLFGIELTLIGIFITFLGLRSIELIIPYSIIAIGLVFSIAGLIKQDDVSK